LGSQLLWSCLLGSDALTKSLCRRTQSQLGIYLRHARLVDKRKQALADRLEGLPIRALRVRFLSVTRGHRPHSIVGGRAHGRMQTRRGRPALQLARVQQRRQVLWHLTEDTSLATGFACLDRVPVAQYLACIRNLCVAENVRVATDQLLAAVLGNLAEIARATLLEQQREKHDLEEHVSQLVKQLGVVAVVYGVSKLIGLLDRVWHDRALILLTIPRALATQQMRQLIERK
jgi:hypothetical protein